MSQVHVVGTQKLYIGTTCMQMIIFMLQPT